MKRINPQTNQPFRCGDYNPETNLYFRGYNKGKVRKTGYYVELWLNPESFYAIRERMKLRARKRRDAAVYQRVKTTEQLVADLYKPTP